MDHVAREWKYFGDPAVICVSRRQRLLVSDEELRELPPKQEEEVYTEE